MTSARLLTRAAGSVGSEIRVVHQKLGELRSPSVVWIVLRNTGRADVASSHFDSDRPLRFGLGTPIIQPLEPVSEGGGPGSRPLVAVIEDNAVLIGPGRFARKQRVTYAVLVDAEAELEIQQNPLIDVDLTTVTQRRSNVARYAFVLLFSPLFFSSTVQLIPGPQGIFLGAAGAAMVAAVGIFITLDRYPS